MQEESRVVIIRFGHDWDETCMQMDEVLSSVADKIKNFAVIYLVDISEVPDFNAMYELYDPCTVMFFFRNKVGWNNMIVRIVWCLLSSCKVKSFGHCSSTHAIKSSLILFPVFVF